MDLWCFDIHGRGLVVSAKVSSALDLPHSALRLQEHLGISSFQSSFVAPVAHGAVKARDVWRFEKMFGLLQHE